MPGSDVRAATPWAPVQSPGLGSGPRSKFAYVFISPCNRRFRRARYLTMEQ